MHFRFRGGHDMKVYKMITIGMGIIIVTVVVLFAAGVFGINGLSPVVTTSSSTDGSSATSETTTFNETTATTTPSATTLATSAPTVAPTTVKPTPTTAKPTTPTTAATTAAFTYTVTEDSIAPAPMGYTTIFINVTPAGTYTVRYDGQLTNDLGGGQYYIQVLKISGNYASHVTVAQ